MYSTVLYTVHTVPMKNKVCQCWGRGKARLYISIRAFPFVYRSAVSNATVQCDRPGGVSSVVVAYIIAFHNGGST